MYLGHRGHRGGTNPIDLVAFEEEEEKYLTFHAHILKKGHMKTQQEGNRQTSVGQEDSSHQKQNPARRFIL